MGVHQCASTSLRSGAPGLRVADTHWIRNPAAVAHEQPARSSTAHQSLPSRRKKIASTLDTSLPIPSSLARNDTISPHAPTLPRFHTLTLPRSTLPHAP